MFKKYAKKRKLPRRAGYYIPRRWKRIGFQPHAVTFRIICIRMSNDFVSEGLARRIFYKWRKKNNIKRPIKSQLHHRSKAQGCGSSLCAPQPVLKFVQRSPSNLGSEALWPRHLELFVIARVANKTLADILKATRMHSSTTNRKLENKLNILTDLVSCSMTNLTVVK